MEPEFEDMMIDWVTFLPRTINGLGDPTYTALDPVRCNVQWTKHIELSDEAEKITADGTVHMGVTPVVIVGWDVLLPTDARGEVVSSTMWRDENGDHHQEIGFSV